MASRTETVADLPTVSLPFGMSKLLECMIRAVVIEKPENMPGFLADYASALLRYRNQNPSMDLKEVMIQFQNRREEVMKRSSEATSDIVEDVSKKSGKSRNSSVEEAALLSKKTTDGEDRIISSKVTPTKSVPEVKLQQKLPLDKEKHLGSRQTSKSSRSFAKNIKTETKTIVPSERLSSSLSPSDLSSSSASAAAAASYKSATSQSPGLNQAFKTSTSLEEEENTPSMWTLYHLPHREEEGTLSTTVLSQPQYQNGAKIQVIGPGYVLVTKCPSNATQTDVKCIRSHCSKVSTQGLGQDCLVIKPPPYQHNNI